MLYDITHVRSDDSVYVYMCVQELNDVYYEPLAEVVPSVDAILAGPPVMKLLFMTHPRIVDSKLKPDWQVIPYLCHSFCLLIMHLLTTCHCVCLLIACLHASL